MAKKKRVTIKELQKEIAGLQKEIESLKEERTKLKRERFRLDSLYELWKKSALRYQGIAAALAHAYNSVFPPDSQMYGGAVRASHSEERTDK